MNQNETVKKIHKKCIQFIHVATAYRRKGLEKPEDVPEVKKQSDYAIDRTIAKVRAAITENGCENTWRQAQEDAFIEYASADADGNLIVNNNEYKYTKENRKLVEVAIRAAEVVKHQTEIAFVPHLMKKVPADLTFEQVEAFRGFVVPEEFEMMEPEGD